MPKFHPNTRMEMLRKLTDWIMRQDEETKDALILWLKGPAGTGKSVITRTLAERWDKEGRLLASFSFSRTDSTRNHSGTLIPTIAYQIYPINNAVQHSMASVIENDPVDIRPGSQFSIGVACH